MNDFQPGDLVRYSRPGYGERDGVVIEPRPGRAYRTAAPSAATITLVRWDAGPCGPSEEWVETRWLRANPEDYSTPIIVSLPRS